MPCWGECDGFGRRRHVGMRMELDWGTKTRIYSISTDGPASKGYPRIFVLLAAPRPLPGCGAGFSSRMESKLRCVRMGAIPALPPPLLSSPSQPRETPFEKLREMLCGCVRCHFGDMGCRDRCPGLSACTWCGTGRLPYLNPPRYQPREVPAPKARSHDCLGFQPQVIPRTRTLSA